jgi:hypothetical protein
MRKLKDDILEVLRDDEQSRNSDIRLTQVLWWRFYNNKMVKLGDGKIAVRLSDLFELPREDHVKRIRAVIQNEENRYLPTSEEVRKKRLINEEKWLAYLEYNKPRVYQQEALFDLNNKNY